MADIRATYKEEIWNQSVRGRRRCRKDQIREKEKGAWNDEDFYFRRNEFDVPV